MNERKNDFATGRLFELSAMVNQQAAYLDMLTARVLTLRRPRIGEQQELLHPVDLDSISRAIRHLEGAAANLRDACTLGKPRLLEAAE